MYHYYSTKVFKFDYTLFIVSFILSYVFMLLVSIFSFQLEELPVVFLVREVFQWWTSIAFFGLTKSLSPIHFWRKVLLGIVILVGNFFLSTLIVSSHFLQICFSWEIHWWYYMGSIAKQVTFLASFTFLSLSLIYENLIMCLRDDLFMFNLSRAFWASWICTPSDLGGFLSLFCSVHFLFLFLSLILSVLQ